ncbi:MAG: HRDC domain-containing protein [Planctomycetia bacterium]|nr:HRDC domain-containing protein [Planctomycetia bacterium]
MPHRLITDQGRFEELCEHIHETGEVAFDTEFLSEHTYRPELCLLQFATRDRSAAVDPFEVRDLSSWWKLMAGGGVNVVVHGGREEVRFCLWLGGARPGRLFDTQIAEGLLSRSYPISYTSLVMRTLDKKTHGKETRTDWRRRPLTDRQIAYAIEDVDFLLEIHGKQAGALESRGRTAWARTKFDRFIGDLEQEPNRESWRRLPGAQGLSTRELAVAREVFQWREQEALQRNKPARRVFRDDLIIELARRQPHDLNELLATRDMNRSDYKRSAPEMLSAIARGLALPRDQCPAVKRTEKDQDEQILAQLLSIALANRCAQMDVAVGIVGTTADLRHLARWHVYNDRSGETPRLLQGWRAEVCGDLLEKVLDGKISLRIGDPFSDHPLIFECRDECP